MVTKALSHPPILLIGATGLIGSALGQLLTQHSYPVRLLLREQQDQAKLRFTPSECLIGDMNNDDVLAKCFSEAAFVLYFANSSIPAQSPTNPIQEITQTLPSLHRLLEIAAATNTHFIYPSSGAVYGNTSTPANESSSLHPTSSYALGKVLSEEIIKFYATTKNLKFSILRFSNIYGAMTPRKRLQGIIDTFLDDAKMQKTSFVWGSVNTIRDYLFVQDTASAVLEIINHPSLAINETFNIGSGEPSSIQNLIDIIQEVTGGQHQYKITQNQFAGPQSSLVDVQKFTSTYPKWKVNFDLRDGIAAAWEKKQAYIENKE